MNENSVEVHPKFPHLRNALFLGNMQKWPHGALKVLFSGPFIESWTSDYRAIIDDAAGQFDERPLVLLPDDIQAADYSPHYDVAYGAEALELFRASTEPAPGSSRPMLLCFDFPPCPVNDADPLLLTLNTYLCDRSPIRVNLIVFTTSVAALPVAAFDHCLTFSQPSEHHHRG